MAAQGLAQQAQGTFAAGINRDVARHLIPGNALYDLVNGLLDDDGSFYRRAGSSYKSTAAATGARVRAVWDGQLLPGQRTLFATDTQWYALAADDVTPVALGGAAPAAPVRGKEFRGIVYLPGGITYGGSRKAADYATGNVDVTIGSTAVVGHGTLWLANVDVGMLLQIAAAGPYYVVAAVNSDTSITLKETYQGATAAGQAYNLARLGVAVNPPAAAPSNWSGTPLFYAVVGNRLLVSNGSARVWESNIGNGYVFTATDYWEIPDGVTVLGLGRVRDTALVFTSGGTWAIGNVGLAMVDAGTGNVQQHLSLAYGDATLWGDAGVARWHDAAVVPTLHGVFILDGASAPQPISGSYVGGVDALVKAYVRAGYKPGGAVVYEGHYLLPILNGDVVVDVLVSRLDRPVFSWRGRRVLLQYPWTRLGGFGGQVLAYAIRQTGGRPDLLAGGANNSRLLSCRYTEPSAGLKNDADGSTHLIVWETRDYATGKGNENLVRRARLRYELVDAAADNPTIQGYHSIGVLQPGTTLWGAFNWGASNWADAAAATFVQMAGSAPEDDGFNPFTFGVGQPPGLGYLPGGVRARYIRFRFQSADPAARLTVRELMLMIRLSEKVD